MAENSRDSRNGDALRAAMLTLHAAIMEIPLKANDFKLINAYDAVLKEVSAEWSESAWPMALLDVLRDVLDTRRAKAIATAAANNAADNFSDATSEMNAQVRAMLAASEAELRARAMLEAAPRSMVAPSLPGMPMEIQEWCWHLDLHLTEHDDRHRAMALMAAWPHIAKWLRSVVGPVPFDGTPFNASDVRALP